MAFRVPDTLKSGHVLQKQILQICKRKVSYLLIELAGKFPLTFEQTVFIISIIINEVSSLVPLTFHQKRFMN